MYVLIVGAVWVGVCPHCGSSLGSLGRCMPSLWEQFGYVYALIVGAVWVGVCPHGGSSLGSLGRCMPSLWEQFG